VWQLGYPNDAVLGFPGSRLLGPLSLAPSGVQTQANNQPSGEKPIVQTLAQEEEMEDGRGQSACRLFGAV